MNSQLNSTTNTTFPSACQGTFTGTGTPCFAIGGFLEESSVRSQRLALTIHKSRHPVDVSEATALSLFNNQATVLRFSALRNHLNTSRINRFLLAMGGVAPPSPAPLHPGQSFSFSRQLLAAHHFATRRQSENQTVAGAQRRPRTGQQVGCLSGGDHAERRTGERKRSLAEATAWSIEAGAKRRGLKHANLRPAAQQLLSVLVQPIKHRSVPLSAKAICAIALLLAHTSIIAAPASNVAAPTVSSTVSSTGSPDLAPELSASRPHVPPTRSRLSASHFTTANDDVAERHRCDDLDLQYRIASRTHPNSVEHELLLEAQRKFAGGVGSEYGIHWPKLKAARGYDKTLSLAICGDYPGRDDLDRCGYLSFSCHDRLLCPRCCYRFLAGPLVDEFGDVALAGMQAFYVCISLSADPDEAARFKYRDFERSDRDGVKGTGTYTPCRPEDYGIPFATEADVDQCRTIWRIFSEVVHEFTGIGRHQRFLGVVGGPELSVQLGPLRVIPHCNFVIWISSFTEDDARELRRLIRAKFRNCRPLKLKAFPSIACYHLRTRDDLRAVLSYSMKPIDLAGQYARAAERVNYEPIDMAALNGDVKTFLGLLPLAFHQVPRITRHGICHPTARGYIGHTTSWRAARRERDAERRRALRQDGSLARRNPKKSKTSAKPKPRCSRSSRFAYWRRAVMPGPPPMPPGRRAVVHPSISPPATGGAQ